MSVESQKRFHILELTRLNDWRCVWDITTYDCQWGGYWPVRETETSHPADLGFFTMGIPGSYDEQEGTRSLGLFGLESEASEESVSLT
mmetsp:Transcript_81483/g.219071  ORF Transcript_81483/g.219071 Transcript_81483/m.219071 type:complete len:88 (-) Transcript_81483:433-696(-)